MIREYIIKISDEIMALIAESLSHGKNRKVGEVE